MLEAQAHSFTQQARLAITLAWVAGYTNAITLLVCLHATSHVTGTASALGTDIVEARWHAVGFAAWLLTLFFLGAALSGLLTELGRRRGWESIYVLPMLAEALLLCGFALGIELLPADTPDRSANWLLVGTASAAMGLQNATITRISSGVVRTTHLTGVLTDLGTETVQMLLWLRDRQRERTQPGPPGTARPAFVHSLRAHPTARRLALLASVVGSFIFGAALGTLAHDHLTRWSMLPPVLFLLVIVWQDSHTPICEIEHSDASDGVTAQMDLPPGIAVFHVRRAGARSDRVDRLPDLLLWCERLPRSTRVAVLDFTDVGRLHADAAPQLQALIQQPLARRRHLILAGLTPEQFAALRLSGAAEGLDVSNVCPDLELAIARGLALLHEHPPTLPLHAGARPS